MYYLILTEIIILARVKKHIINFFQKFQLNNKYLNQICLNTNHTKILKI